MEWLLPLQSVWADVSVFVPRLGVALLALLVGVALARLAQAVTGALCRLLRLDAKLEKVWLFRPWASGPHGHLPSQSLASFVYYLVLFVVTLLSVRLLGVEIGQSILTALLGLLPRMFSFLMIIFLGALLAMFFSVIAQLVLDRSGIQHPNFWGKVIAWGTFGVAVVFSLEQLGVVGSLLSAVVLIGLGAAGLAAAIAVGLGCKDLAREFLIELIKGEKKEP